MLVRKLWSSIERASDYTLLQTYQPIIDDPMQAVRNNRLQIWRETSLTANAPLVALDLTNFLYAVGQLLREHGYLQEALHLQSRAVPETDEQNRIMVLMEQGHGLLTDGQITKSLSAFEEAMRLSERIGDQYLYMQSAGNAARCYRQRKEYKQATRLNAEAEEIARANDFQLDLSIILGNQGNVLIEQKKLDEALRLHEEAAYIARQIDHADSIQRALGNQAVVIWRKGDSEQAKLLFNQKAEICRDYGLFNGLAIALYNLGRVYYDNEQNAARAAEAFVEAVHAARQAGNRYLLIVSLGMNGAMLTELGRLEDALVLHKEEEMLSLEVGDYQALKRSRIAQSQINKLM